MDIFGETVPKRTKIYAIRAPAPSSSQPILAQRRSVGIVFNWEQTVGFNRAKGGDNTCAFTFKPGIAGTYGSLAKAYEAATEFLNAPAQHEGPLIENVDTVPPNSEPRFPWSVWIIFWTLLTNVLAKMSITSKFVVASILVSVLFYLTYNALIYIEEVSGCTRSGSSAIGPLCRNLVGLQLLIQNNMAEFVDAFFTQLKVGFVLLVKHVVDEMFD